MGPGDLHLHCDFNDFVCPTAANARSRRKRLFRELSNPTRRIPGLARNRARQLLDPRLRTQARPEAKTTVDIIRYFGGLGSELKGETIPFGEHVLSYTRREPLGVVGAISNRSFELPRVISRPKKNRAHDRVLPVFDSHRVKQLRVLTDRGSEYCGNPTASSGDDSIVVADMLATSHSTRRTGSSGGGEPTHCD